MHAQGRRQRRAVIERRRARARAALPALEAAPPLLLPHPRHRGIPLYPTPDSANAYLLCVEEESSSAQGARERSDTERAGM